VRADDEEFVEFATVAGGRLQRTAFMLCGDWHTAEDLAQTALIEKPIVLGVYADVILMAP
jgi:DNA-directed RNA polymerase specialized sigma24 family protein